MTGGSTTAPTIPDKRTPLNPEGAQRHYAETGRNLKKKEERENPEDAVQLDANGLFMRGIIVSLLAIGSIPAGS